MKQINPARLLCHDENLSVSSINISPCSVPVAAAMVKEGRHIRTRPSMYRRRHQRTMSRASPTLPRVIAHGSKASFHDTNKRAVTSSEKRELTCMLADTNRSQRTLHFRGTYRRLLLLPAVGAPGAWMSTLNFHLPTYILLVLAFKHSGPGEKNPLPFARFSAVSSKRITRRLLQ